MHNNGTISLQDVIRKTTVCFISLPATHLLATPWSPIFTLDSVHQTLFIRGIAIPSFIWCLINTSTHIAYKRIIHYNCQICACTVGTKSEYTVYMLWTCNMRWSFVCSLIYRWPTTQWKWVYRRKRQQSVCLPLSSVSDCWGLQNGHKRSFEGSKKRKIHRFGEWMQSLFPAKVCPLEHILSLPMPHTNSLSNIRKHCERPQLNHILPLLAHNNSKLWFTYHHLVFYQLLTHSISCFINAVSALSLLTCCAECNLLMKGTKPWRIPGTSSSSMLAYPPPTVMHFSGHGIALQRIWVVFIQE